MIRAVLDSNIVIAMLPASDGTMLRLRSQWLAGRFTLVTSSYIIGEVRRGWKSAYWTARVSPERSGEFLDLLRSRSEWIAPRVEVVGVARHAEDDPVLAAAASAIADCLVTGDAELQAMKSFAGVRIVSPAQFVNLLDAVRA